MIRRLPIGAEPQPGGGVHFRVWAPKRQSVHAVLEFAERSAQAVPLDREPSGYFSGFVPDARPGTRYRYRIDEGDAFPDPASRFQPDGVHGPSLVVDPAYEWTDTQWRGVGREGQILYEMHIGTFTPEGTWRSAMQQLPALAELGITTLEVMPVAEFPGEFGWGYDGVDLFAPTRLYGEPDDFRAFVDRAHALGLGVILDVVYNHIGPDGNYLRQFAGEYFTDRYDNEWGDAINFDGPDSGAVREFFIANARYWIDEFHLDGLRLDATQSIFDSSPEHILAQITRAARDAAGGRRTFVVGENEPQHARLARPFDRGGYDLDALWNDDFHHTAKVAATGRREAYYLDYGGTPQELVSAVRHGFLYQGQRYAWQNNRRGTPAFDLPPAAFVHFLDNHDQVANSARGERLHQRTSPGRYRALTALLLLGPATPMLFQGQEFCASTPWYYFADHEGELGHSVARGRREFLSQFPGIAQPDVQQLLPDPRDPANFHRCKLHPAERDTNSAMLALHRDLIGLRNDQPPFRAQRSDRVDGAVLGTHAFVLRWFSADGDDRLLIINLGTELRLVPAPEPLLAPPTHAGWRTLWSSESARYGGSGTAPLETQDGWIVPGESATVLRPA
jgi:maltooligosyltrehalose trehalohydrolase